ncbi:MAG: SUMF1/EgtB/PvdO family nonheme iron enzyme [Planctomycetota bacterium]|nr:SUMF1/EgtB/PvdO family nonheme iron enzyme [Planctomycetota bacterium]
MLNRLFSCDSRCAIFTTVTLLCSLTLMQIPASAADVLQMSDGLRSLEMVEIGAPGNLPDDNGLGAVPYAYKISKYEVTAAQFAEFLRAKASKTDPYDLRSNNMEETGGCGITRKGNKGAYEYTLADDLANCPVNQVNFWDACRFVNWLQNGQGDADTETGAYTLKGYTGEIGIKIHRNPGAKWFLPNENEWYKAAYFDPKKPDGPGYWNYPTRSDTRPGRDLLGANSANYFDGTYLDEAKRLTPVGAFSRVRNAFGTCDQAGNVLEMTETLMTPPFLRSLWGGSWGTKDAGVNVRSYNRDITSRSESELLGFRVASVVAGGENGVAVPSGDSVSPSPAADQVAEPAFARRPWRDPLTGKPFFPMGWYIWDCNVSELDEMQREKCNVVLYVNSQTDIDEKDEQLAENLPRMIEFLDQAHQRGLKVLMQCAWHQAFRDEVPEFQARVVKFVQAVKDHPGLMGYQLFDEPEYQGGSGSLGQHLNEKMLQLPDALRRTKEAIRAVDTNPNHVIQVVFNLVPLSSWMEFLPAVDGFQIDRYPIWNGAPYLAQEGDWGPLVMAWSCAHGAKEVRFRNHLNPVPVMQGVGSGHNENGVEDDGNWWRNPTYEETRYMAYSSLTAGGWGFLHWIRNSSCADIKRNVTRLQAEFHQLMPALQMSYENPPFTVRHGHMGIKRSFLVDCVPDISTLTLEDQDNYYLIASNNSGKLEDIAFRMKLPKLKGDGARSVSVLNEDWSRSLTYDPATEEWVIAKHKMAFGDINV